MNKEGIRNKQRPFRLLRYLFENTDEEHPVTTTELVEIFQAEDAHASWWRSFRRRTRTRRARP